MAYWKNIKRSIDFDEVDAIRATRAEIIDGKEFSQTIEYSPPESDREILFSYTKEQISDYLSSKLPIDIMDDCFAQSAAVDEPIESGVEE